MAELGLDVSTQSPQLMVDEMLTNNPRVFTMGCGGDSEACPSLRLEDVVDWGLPDPKGRPIEDVRQIRDEIAMRVEGLLQELTSQTNPAATE